MAYNLHIEHPKHWESEENRIDLKEWLSYCESQPDMRIEKNIVAVNPATGEKIEIPTEGSCFWSHSSGEEYLFTYSRGRVTFGTEEVELTKAKEMAERLNAIVVGEEGEEY